MTSEKQAEANRLNALKSTGPRTPEGKAAVRYNSLKHGLRARATVLPGENCEEFEQLCADLEAEWQPQTPTEGFLVERIAVTEWKLGRAAVGEKSIFAAIESANKQLPSLNRIMKYEMSLENSQIRAINALTRLQRQHKRTVSAPAVAIEPATDVANKDTNGFARHDSLISAIQPPLPLNPALQPRNPAPQPLNPASKTGKTTAPYFDTDLPAAWRL